MYRLFQVHYAQDFLSGVIPRALRYLYRSHSLQFRLAPFPVTYAASLGFLALSILARVYR